MAKVHDVLEMWQWSQNLFAAQTESGVQNRQMRAIEYISDTETVFIASWVLL